VGPILKGTGPEGFCRTFIWMHLCRSPIPIPPSQENVFYLNPRKPKHRNIWRKCVSFWQILYLVIDMSFWNFHSNWGRGSVFLDLWIKHECTKKIPEKLNYVMFEFFLQRNLHTSTIFLYFSWQNKPRWA